VQFVDEDDDLSRSLLDLLEHGLQPLLELAAVLGPGDHAAEVERDQLAVLQRLRNVSVHDALREPLDDRRLADAGLADEDRVVLRAAREHLDRPADLLVSPDDRVELALARVLGEVAAEALERLVGVLGGLARDRLRAQLLDRLDELVARRADLGVAVVGERHEQYLARDVLVAELLRLALRALQDVDELGVVVRAGARVPLQLRQQVDGVVGVAADLLDVHGKVLEQLRHERVRLLEQREQEMVRVDLRVPARSRELLRRLDRLLRLDRELVCLHI
jgi:hypothetical protein